MNHHVISTEELKALKDENEALKEANIALQKQYDDVREQLGAMMEAVRFYRQRSNG